MKEIHFFNSFIEGHLDRYLGTTIICKVIILIALLDGPKKFAVFFKEVFVRLKFLPDLAQNTGPDSGIFE